MAKATIRTIRIDSIGEEQRSSKGFPFAECRTDAGIVAFWGSAGRRVNLDKLRRLSTPVTVVAGCRPPSEGFPLHHLWVPETADFRVEISEPLAPAPVEADIPTLDELRRWRRELADHLRRIDLDGDSAASLAGQIRTLAHAGRIPRDIAAMMRVVTETRNAVEHDDKQLSQAEGSAARAAWAVVRDWIDGDYRSTDRKA